MMTTSPYNSALAIATRITVILAARPQVMRTERGLAAIDLLTTNAGQFGLYPANLHGDSIFVATEFAARSKNITKGLRYAVTHELITPVKDDNGIRFTINDNGKSFVSKLASQYLTDYQRALNPVLAYVDSRTDREVTRRIEQHGIEPIKEDRP